MTSIPAASLAGQCLGQRLRSVPRSEGQRRRTEWVILRARYAAAGIGVVVTLMVLDTPRQRLWIAALILGVTAALTHLALLRRPTGRWLSAVGIGSFALDGLAVITTLAVVREDPADPVNLVALLLAIEAGMRWQVIGGLLGGLGAGLVAVMVGAMVRAV